MSLEFARAIETRRVANLAELIEALQLMQDAAQAEGQGPTETYVNGSDSPTLGLTLVERTLTDGSKVYDVEVG